MGATLSYDASRLTLRGGSTDAYTLVNLHYRSPDLGPLRAEVSVFNALDADFRHPGGLEHRQEGMPQDGRTLRVAVSAGF